MYERQSVTFVWERVYVFVYVCVYVCVCCMCLCVCFIYVGGRISGLSNNVAISD